MQHEEKEEMDDREEKNKGKGKEARKPVILVRTIMHNRPLRPFEKAYMFWYIEMLKPPDQRNQDVINEKYKFCK